MKLKSILSAFAAIAVTVAMTSCSDDEPYVLNREDIKVEVPTGGFTVEVGQELIVTVNSVSDEAVTYKWYLDDELISTSKDLRYIFDEAGRYELTLVAAQYDNSFRYEFPVTVKFNGINPPSTEGTPYITKVLDYMPAVGQFVNTMPAYEEGDTRETMNAKVLAAIGNNNRKAVSLGGFGGYVTVGFDHTIENREGLRDFRVLGNAFYAATSAPDAPEGGSFEPGIIMVAYDRNGNGMPDEDEWYEIAGSGQVDPTGEPWYNIAKEHGNDMNLYTDYEITYFRPETESADPEEKYIRWEDNKGNSGYRAKNNFHKQPYFPQWIKSDKQTFRGTCLPQNCVLGGTDYIRYKFRYGYADNGLNNKDDSAIDIDWAVNAKGQSVNLPGVDFIKIYTGVNQENEWIGECSTEVAGVEDLHLLNVKIPTR